MATAHKPRVIIAGAGIGGLTAALALLKAGIDCEIYEQAKELQEVGAGLQISPNGNRALFNLGLEKDVRRDGVETRDKEIRLWSTGQAWSLFDPKVATAEQRYGYPMYLMHRGDLHAMLVRAVQAIKPDAITLQARCMDFEQDDAGVRLRFEDGRSAAGDILVGADGLHSRIRQKLFGPATPRFTGVVAWRGMVPVDRLEPHQRRSVSSQWIGPKGHATCYPVRRGQLLNFVGEVERDDWREESWIERGSLEECLSDFPNWHQDLRHIVSSTEALYKWALFLREPLPQWSVGRVTLLGDACHPTIPFLGQGANMAMEDGFVLGRCVQKYVDDPKRGLVSYENARRERTTKIVQRSAAMLNTFHNDALSSPTEAAKYVDAQWHPDKIRDRYDWIYTYDVTSVEI